MTVSIKGHLHCFVLLVMFACLSLPYQIHFILCVAEQCLDGASDLSVNYRAYCSALLWCFLLKNVGAKFCLLERASTKKCIAGCVIAEVSAHWGFVILR